VYIQYPVCCVCAVQGICRHSRDPRARRLHNFRLVRVIRNVHITYTHKNIVVGAGEFYIIIPVVYTLYEFVMIILCRSGVELQCCVGIDLECVCVRVFACACVWANRERERETRVQQTSDKNILANLQKKKKKK